MKPTLLADLLKIVIKENHLEKGLNQVKLHDLWHEIMGQGVVNYTEKIQLQGETLIIHLTSSVLREELSYGKEKIAQMLNEALGENLIKKVRLV
jgi:flagellar biosynthesis/type III secretory pathway protein FliH